MLVKEINMRTGNDGQTFHATCDSQCISLTDNGCLFTNLCVSFCVSLLFLNLQLMHSTAGRSERASMLRRGGRAGHGFHAQVRDKIQVSDGPRGPQSRYLCWAMSPRLTESSGRHSY